MPKKLKRTPNPPAPGSALAAAVRLHDYIRSNAGETADWPLQVTASDPGALDRLDALLREFRSALRATPNVKPETQPMRGPNLYRAQRLRAFGASTAEMLSPNDKVSSGAKDP